jgi:hypothetical protein
LGGERAAGQARTVGGGAKFGELLVAEIEPDGAAALDRLAGPAAGRTGTRVRLPMIGSVRHACLVAPDDERLRPLSFFANPSTR